VVQEQVAAIVADMLRFRGSIEDGFCVRRVEGFLPEIERRSVVIDALPRATSGGVPWIVDAGVVLRAERELRIVEVGNGQVSDLAG
jgi:hypothetical protein